MFYVERKNVHSVLKTKLWDFIFNIFFTIPVLQKLGHRKFGNLPGYPARMGNPAVCSLSLLWLSCHVLAITWLVSPCFAEKVVDFTWFTTHYFSSSALAPGNIEDGKHSHCPREFKVLNGGIRQLNNDYRAWAGGCPEVCGVPDVGHLTQT